jgi:SAM-dependent methyltransferase
LHAGDTRRTDAGTWPDTDDVETHVKFDEAEAAGETGHQRHQRHQRQPYQAGQAALTGGSLPHGPLSTYSHSTQHPTQSPASPQSADGAYPTSAATASSPETSPTAATPTAGINSHRHQRSQKQHKQKLAKPAATTTSTASPDFHAAHASHSPHPQPVSHQRVAPPRTGLSASELKYVVTLPANSDHHPPAKHSKSAAAGPVGPASATNLSLPSASGATVGTVGTTRALWSTMTTSSDPSGSADTLNTLANKPLVLRNGRTYLNDASLAYPLPVDLTELHRQSLRTLLLIQIFGAPVCSPALTARPPSRVLEVGCGSGFWSMMCHRYFRERGHSGISFTGLDIAPLAPGSGPGQHHPQHHHHHHHHPSHDASATAKPDRDMNWRFVQHDMRQTPFPFADGEFDLVMVKDMSLATTNSLQQRYMDEYVRLLRPGGTLEIWESDHTIRMLRPHVPEPKITITASLVLDDEEQEAATTLGAYVMSANTPLSSPLNNFLVEYNMWITRALESRDLCVVPCTRVGPNLLQESDTLTDVRSRRLAVPLSEVRWEKENVSGVITKDGKSYIDTKSIRSKGPKADEEKRHLTPGQAALRRTALMTVVQQVQSLEPVLREASGKRQDEWDIWIGKMMNDLLKENGTSWGECLEVGAWWAKKKR